MRAGTSGVSSRSPLVTYQVPLEDSLDYIMARLKTVFFLKCTFSSAPECNNTPESQTIKQVFYFHQHQAFSSGLETFHPARKLKIEHKQLKIAPGSP